MFPENNVYKVLTGVIIVVVIAILIFVGVLMTNTNEDKQDVVINATATPVSTEEPVATQRPPIYVIRVTATPNVITPTREPTEAPTETPTHEPTEAPTEVPTQEPTEEPTETPTQEPTEEPTEAPTQEPTEAPTETPTQEPTEAPTQTPTQEPTSAPTATPVTTPTEPVVVVPTLDPVTQYVQIEKEMATLTMSGGIYPDYTVEARKDLYDYISVEGIDQEQLFGLLRRPFEDGIASWTAMVFDSSKNACEQLDFALKSSICDVCGRVIIEEHQENQIAVWELFEEIEREEEFATANQLLLEYLNNYTVRNPDNPNERWFVGCKIH